MPPKVIVARIPNRHRPDMGKSMRLAIALAKVASPGVLIIVDGRRLYRWQTGDITDAAIVDRLARAGKLTLDDGLARFAKT